VWRYEGPRGISWRIRYRDASGRRVLETLGKEPAWTRKRAEAELRKRLVDVERVGYRKPEKLTFAAFAERWLRDYLPARGLKPTTVRSYEAALRCHLLPSLGHYLLTDLEQSPEIVDRYVASKMEEGLRPKTVSNQIVLLQLMLKRAVRWRLMHWNPVEGCERPREEQVEMNVLTEAEIALLRQERLCFQGLS
jgi:hypothetical protein